MTSNPVSYVGPMSEDDYLAIVERIQQAMAIEPFRPPLIDVVKLLSDWRDLSNQNERLRVVVDAARAFVTWHQRGQPGAPDTLYPMTYGGLDHWHAEWDRSLETLANALKDV